MIYRFDRFELSPEAEQLRKGSVVIHLGPQAFRLLLMLVSRAGTVITREEIRDELWGTETFVDFDPSINAVIRRIRFALNDQADTPRFLATLPRRGYNFIMPVEFVPGPGEEHPSPPIVPAQPPVPVPAAPPMRRRSRVRDVAVLCALAITLFPLAGPRIRDRRASATDVLRVKIAPVTFEPGAAPLDPRTLECELHNRLAAAQPEKIRVTTPGDPADLLVDTALWKAADGASIDVIMTRSDSGREVWRERFRRSGTVSDFTLEVAVRVTRAVVDFIPRTNRERPIHTRVSPRALTLYHRGQELRMRPLPQRDVNVALASLTNAVEIEPGFVEAWSAIGDLWTLRAYHWSGPSRAEAVANARVALDRAIAGDPRCAEALNSRALLLMHFESSWNEAEVLMRRSVAADPAYLDARVNLALLLAAMGRTDEALMQMRQAKNLDPNSSLVNLGVAFIYLLDRRYDDAFAEYRASLVVLRRFEPVQWDVMCAAMAAGRWDDAARLLSIITGTPVEIPPDARDPRAEFRKSAERVQRTITAKENLSLDPYQIACFHALLGETESAFAALRRTNRSTNSIFALVDPRLDSIRNDPRYLQHMVRLGLIR